jgi:phenylalanyl-tRNA synthetase beta chain
LLRLGLELEAAAEGHWIAVPPSWRFDLHIEADLIEEIARVYGYDRLESQPRRVALPALSARGLNRDQARQAAVLRERGYSEAITYSFVEPGLQAALTGGAEAVVLDNPISDQLVEMRRTLWASLLPSWVHNMHRQQSTVRLFEQGLRFVPEPAAEHGIAQIPTLAGLAIGTAEDVHWDRPARDVDFFDVKGDVEALFTGTGVEPVFAAARHPALHPGRSARIAIDGALVGWLGQLAPEFKKYYKNIRMPYVFEINSEVIRRLSRICYESISEQPQVRRDLAVVISEEVPAGSLISLINTLEIKELKSITVFDVFRGEGVESGCKSIALGLIFQDKTSTLTDENVDTIISRVIEALRVRCGAHIRG